MKRFLLFATALHATTLLAAAEPLKLLTEPYPGYSFEEGGEIRGAGADQVREIMNASGVGYTMELLPWARAYKLATSSANTCIFATNHTPERDKLFKWIEPLGGGRVVLIRKAGSGVNPATLEEAKAYAVGVQRGDYAEGYLTGKGFRNLDLAPDFGLTLKKLTSGRIDLAMTSEAAFKAELAKGAPLEVVQTMPAAIYALACSLDIPDATIASLQAALHALVLDGRQDRLYVKYGMPPQNMQDFVQKTD